MKYKNKSFTVPIQIKISQEQWDNIFKKEQKSKEISEDLLNGENNEN